MKAAAEAVEYNVGSRWNRRSAVTGKTNQGWTTLSEKHLYKARGTEGGREAVCPSEIFNDLEFSGIFRDRGAILRKRDDK